MFVKKCLQKKISHTPLQKYNGPSLKAHFQPWCNAAVWFFFWTTTFVWIRIPELFGFELLWWVSKLWQPTGGPGSSCEIIILRNNSHGEIIRVSVGIFTTAVRNKNMRRILNRNTSPYFHSAFLVILPLTMLKGTHFSELSISRFSTYIYKGSSYVRRKMYFIFLFLRVVVNIPIQTLIISPRLLFRKIII